MSVFFRLIVFRILQGIVVMFVVTMLTFVLLGTTGGDALTALQNDPMVSRQALDKLRKVYSLDQPIYIRYARWLNDFLHGNMGVSFQYNVAVERLLLPRLLNTSIIALLALIFAWTVALLLGTRAAQPKYKYSNWLTSFLVTLLSSTPRLVIALLMLALLPSFLLGQHSGTNESGSAFSFLQAIPPAFALAAPLLALFLAQVQESMKTALRQDFVTFARAKGLKERTVIFRHALRAALNPLITIGGYSLGGVMSGSVIVETIFGWQGLGSLSVVAVRSRDVPLLMGVLVITSAIVLIGNLLADILQQLNDPRLRDVRDSNL